MQEREREVRERLEQGRERGGLDHPFYWEKSGRGEGSAAT
jgi:hypothetical protein